MATILVPLDGSPLSERALPLAAALARELNMELRLLHVREPSASLDNEREVQAAFQATKWHVRQAYGFEPQAEICSGYAARVIAEKAGQADVWCVVMASRSREALVRTVLGSVAEEVVDESPVAVFLVPASVEAPGLPRFKRILLPLDGSERAEAIREPVKRFARLLGAEMTVLRVFEPVPVADRASHDVLAGIGQLVDGVTPQELAPHSHERRRPRTVERIELGEPAKAIALACGREHADLVALATYGRTSPDRAELSRVAEAVLRHSRVPLMVFGREALRRLMTGTAHEGSESRQT